ncbi:MAG TPA: hypothetical protein VJR89_35065 [Polyangiales bacterium]|nr:hypothetical protein [Polyangiales bacterium]
MERALLVAAVCTALSATVVRGQEPRNAWLAVLLERDATSWTPAVARKRFAKLVALETARPTPQLLILAGGDLRQRVELACAPSSDDAHAERSFRCSRIALRVVAETNAEAGAVHRSLERQLRAKLGEPRYVRRDDGPLPNIGWQRARVEVSLSEQSQTVGELVRYFVEVSIRRFDA